MAKRTRVAWLRARLDGHDETADATLDEVFCIYLRAGGKTKQDDSAPPSVQCPICGVSIATQWQIGPNKFVAESHECTTPWRYESNLRHAGNKPEPSLDDAIGALLLTAWSFTDYDPRRPNKVRKVVRILYARTEALRNLARIAQQFAPNTPELHSALEALALE